MSYVVLARKYRPSTFAELVGQKHIVRTLSNAITMERVHHAFVFTGARGVGKTSTARLLARGLNCAQGPTLTPCAECGSCQDIARGSAQDVIEIDGASHTGVDHVRALRETVRYLPATGRFKLYIIDEVHMLSTAAFNALLKTLEEPPAHVKFILATTEPHKIPATILSRTQRLDFRRVSMATLTEHLRDVTAREQLTLSPQALGLIARQSQGSVRDALSLLDQVLNYAGADADETEVASALGAVDQALISTLAHAVAVADADKALEGVAVAEERGHDLAEIADLLAEHLHDVALVKTLKQPAKQLVHRTADELTVLAEQGARRSHSDWQRLFALAHSLALDVGRSSMPRVTFEMGLLRMMLVAPTTDLSTLMLRLDDLLGQTPVPTGPSAQPNPSAHQREAALEPPALPDAPLRDERPTKKSPGAPRPHPPEEPSVPEANTSLAAPDTAARPQSDAAQSWRSFVGQVRQTRPALGSVLERGQLVAFAADCVQVAFARQTFWWDAVNDQDNRALMRDVLTQQMGRPYALQVLDLEEVDSHGETLADERERNSREGWEAIATAARDHTAVREASAILGAEIGEVRPPQAPPFEAGL